MYCLSFTYAPPWRVSPLRARLTTTPMIQFTLHGMCLPLTASSRSYTDSARHLLTPSPPMLFMLLVLLLGVLVVSSPRMLEATGPMLNDMKLF